MSSLRFILASPRHAPMRVGMALIASALIGTLAACDDSPVAPKPPKILTILGAGNGAGGIVITPSAATCTSSAGQVNGTCAMESEHGATITLTPSPAAGSAFTGWAGGCLGTAACTLVMDQDRIVIATFTLLKRDLTVDVGG